MWFKALNGGSIPDTMTCLEMAAGGEHDEWTEMYPRMAAEAKEEGFTQLAALFTMVAQIEKEHEERYRELAENLKNNTVFAREEQQVWQCRNCGYTYIGKSAPLKCPVCAHPQSYFELKKHNYWSCPERRSSHAGTAAFFLHKIFRKNWHSRRNRVRKHSTLGEELDPHWPDV